MPKPITRKWDPARHLDSGEAVALYLRLALEEGDPAVLTAVLGDIARSKGMAKVAKRTGMGRESLYKALSSDGNPRLSTLLKVIEALGLELRVVPAKSGQTVRGHKSKTSSKHPTRGQSRTLHRRSP